MTDLTTEGAPYSIGDIVTFTDYMGTARTGRVVAKEAAIMHGLPGFDIEDSRGQRFWGWDSQITLIDGPTAARFKVGQQVTDTVTGPATVIEVDLEPCDYGRQPLYLVDFDAREDGQPPAGFFGDGPWTGWADEAHLTAR